MPAVRLPAAAVDVTRGLHGTLIRNREPLKAYPGALVERLEHWAHVAPDRVLLAERDASGGFCEVTYVQALETVRAIAQALLDRGLSVERPVAILSENAVDHGLLGFAAQYAGIPHVPISPAYSLVSTDFAKLRDVVGQVTPGLVYVSDGARFARALDAAIPPETELVVSTSPPSGRTATPFASLIATRDGPAVDAARARVGPDTIAKILFTSGSTGSPKGVVNTQRMLCSNQQMIRQMFPFLADDPPTIVDWLPWNHTFGGNHNVGLVLYNGGTLYVNAGRPISAAAFGETLRNLREIAPTVHFDVPKGFEMLVVALRAEPALRERFFSRLRMLFYAGAGIAPHVWDALQELSREATGGVFITTSLGSTETAPAALAACWQAEGPGFVGIPMPGVGVKLVPSGEKLELRLRGPNIMPAYWRNDELTRAAFDDEGYYCIGDALRFADERDPARGFVFDGRIAEDFKLATGTWVSAGTLRLRVIGHFAPLLTDVAVSGANRDEVAVLAFVDLERARAIATDVEASAAAPVVLASAALRRHLHGALQHLARSSSGSAARIARLVLLAEPPSLDAGEITDKGSLNPRAILRRRAALADDAHRTPPPPHVIALDEKEPPR